MKIQLEEQDKTVEIPGVNSLIELINTKSNNISRPMIAHRDTIVMFGYLYFAMIGRYSISEINQIITERGMYINLEESEYSALDKEVCAFIEAGETQRNFPYFMNAMFNNTMETFAHGAIANSEDEVNILNDVFNHMKA